MRGSFALFFLATSATGGAVQAQTLDIQPAPFHDFRTGAQARHGEVVLGRTTVASALRMFSELLSSDRVVVPRGHSGNPSSWPAGTVWKAANREVRPRHALELGPDRYTLYFDENSRLIVAITPRMPGELTRALFSAQYPTLKKGRRRYSGDQPRSDEWSVSLSDCVTLNIEVSIQAERVEQLSYMYTCPTQPSKSP